MDESRNLDDHEISTLVSLLARLKPGFLPKDVFYQVARVSALPILEIVPLRRTANGGIEVLLTRRRPDDPFWPDLWHNPGTVLRAGDTLSAAFDRLLRDELEGATLRQEPVFVETLIQATERGDNVAQVYWIELADSAKTGAYYPVDALPADIVNSSRDIISGAAKAYTSALVGRAANQEFQPSAKNYIISSGA